ncbi:MAG: Dak phosphatase, partial [Nocardioides sp.]
ARSAEPVAPSRPPADAATSAGGPASPADAEPCPDGPSYEVMYLLDAEEDRIPALRTALGALGDSLVVVGGEGEWNVHIHVDDVGRAIEAGIEAGRPHRIHVTHFADQVRSDAERAGSGAGRVGPRRGRTVVAVSAGPGLAELYRSAGAVPVPAEPGRQPGFAELVRAIEECGAAEVIVLPNDGDIRRVAEAAARAAEDDLGIAVVVIPTTVQVQALAALAVHDPGKTLEGDVLEMTATARHARHGAVTVAARRAITMAGPCQPGDVLGVIDGDFTEVGDDLEEVAIHVLDRLVGSGGELVTLVSGLADPDRELAAAVLSWLETEHPSIDAVSYHGGQDRYPLLISVE